MEEESMEEKSWRRNHGGVIMKERSWRKNNAEEILDKKS